MAGRMGGEQVTVQNLEIVAIDLENNVILIKGNVPGPKKSLVFVKSAIKNTDKVNETVELITYVEETAEVVEENTNEEASQTQE